MSEQEATIDERIWQVVAAIPSGKVCSYGEVAARAGLPGGARRVGRSMGRLPKGSRIPWYRVINASGRISIPTTSPGHQKQRDLLEAEGVEFRLSGSIDLKRFGWK